MTPNFRPIMLICIAATIVATAVFTHAQESVESENWLSFEKGPASSQVSQSDLQSPSSVDSYSSGQKPIHISYDKNRTGTKQIEYQALQSPNSSSPKVGMPASEDMVAGQIPQSNTSIPSNNASNKISIPKPAKESMSKAVPEKKYALQARNPNSKRWCERSSFESCARLERSAVAISNIEINPVQIINCPPEVDEKLK